ncbi:MAG: hypothetical protein ACRDDA_01235, partial [Aeromonas sp.]
KIRSCLSCGLSRYLGDGSSIHYFYQASVVKYFYCSKKVFETYSADGFPVEKNSICCKVGFEAWMLVMCWSLAGHVLV